MPKPTAPQNTVPTDQGDFERVLNQFNNLLKAEAPDFVQVEDSLELLEKLREVDPNKRYERTNYLREIITKNVKYQKYIKNLELQQKNANLRNYLSGGGFLAIVVVTLIFYTAFPPLLIISPVVTAAGAYAVKKLNQESQLVSAKLLKHEAALKAYDDVLDSPIQKLEKMIKKESINPSVVEPLLENSLTIENIRNAEHGLSPLIKTWRRNLKQQSAARETDAKQCRYLFMFLTPTWMVTAVASILLSPFFAGAVAVAVSAAFPPILPVMVLLFVASSVGLGVTYQKFRSSGLELAKIRNTQEYLDGVPSKMATMLAEQTNIQKEKKAQFKAHVTRTLEQLKETQQQLQAERPDRLKELRAQYLKARAERPKTGQAGLGRERQEHPEQSRHLAQDAAATNRKKQAAINRLAGHGQRRSQTRRSGKNSLRGHLHHKQVKGKDDTSRTTYR